MARYSTLLENPRRRSRRSRRRNPSKRRTRSRRARAIVRRRIGRRGRKAVRSTRRAGLNLAGGLQVGGFMFGGKFVGELIDAALARSLSFYAGQNVGYRRLGLGLVLPMVTRMVPGRMLGTVLHYAAAFNVVAGLDALTVGMRDHVRQSLGLPWQLNAGMAAPGLSDYVTDAN